MLFLALSWLTLTLGLAVSDAVLGHWGSAAISALYAACLGYGITHFIGWRASLEDVRLWLSPTRGDLAGDVDVSDPQEV